MLIVFFCFVFVVHICDCFEIWLIVVCIGAFARQRSNRGNTRSRLVTYSSPDLATRRHANSVSNTDGNDGVYRELLPIVRGFSIGLLPSRRICTFEVSCCQGFAYIAVCWPFDVACS